MRILPSFALIVAVVALTACNAQTAAPADASADPTPTATATVDHAAAKEACEAQGQRYSRAIGQCHGELPDPDRTPRPTPTAAPVDPDLAFQVFQEVFAADDADLLTALADAIEVDFYWIDSVDRIDYDIASHTVLMEATVLFETIYANDPQEWRNDTWTLFRDVARDFWGPFTEGFEDSAGDVLGAQADWPRFIPTMELNGNAGRLRVSCPGSLTYAIIQRQATQTEFEAECTITP